MNRPTLSNFRAQWPSETMGICQADPQVGAYCNDAQQRLLMDPLCPESGWWGTWMRMNFSATVSNGTAYITTPYNIARLTDLAACTHPIHIRNGFYEFLAYGRGLQPKLCQATGCGSTFQAFDRDSVYTLTDLVGTKTIRIYPSDVRDTGRRILLQGKDQNGVTVLTTDPGSGQSAPGEYAVFSFPFSNSVNQFSEISGIMKDQSWGPIQLFQVDPTTGNETPLSAMEPNEGTSLFRRYMINGIPSTNLCCQGVGTVQLTAMARIDFTPVSNETDYLCLPNIPALLEESQSLRFARMESSNASEQSMLHHIRAINLLNGMLDLYEGKESVAVKMPLWGSQRLKSSFR